MSRGKEKKVEKKRTGEEAAPAAAPEPSADEELAEAIDVEAAEAAIAEAMAEVEPSAEAARRTAELEAEVADLKDKLLRALAETENVRRRAERDRNDASRYAIANFAVAVLGVADNLRRALESVDAEVRGKDEAVESLFVGVELTERELLNTLERFDIRAVDALDTPFDHNLHEAMFEVEDPERPAGTVVQVLQTGYLLSDRLLRPAKVAVSKGGPKAESAGTAASGETPARGSTAAYEKQADGSGGAAGSKVDRKL